MNVDVIYQVIFFLLGAIWGSFANVVILRTPRHQSVVTPRSACASCGKIIFWFDNIPIISWFVLRGKCRFCSAPFSIRYSLVELIMAVLFWGLYYKLGWNWFLLEYIIFFFGLVVVSFIDFDHMILPDFWTLSGIGIGLLGSVLNPERFFWESFLGFFIGGGFLWAAAYFYWLLRKEEGMGGGDIKLLAWIGAVLGWKCLPFVIIVSCLVGSLIGIVLAVKNHDLKTRLPFGPYLALGAILYVFLGHEIGDWYFNLFLPGVD